MLLRVKPGLFGRFFFFFVQKYLHFSCFFRKENLYVDEDRTIDTEDIAKKLVLRKE